MAKQWWMWFKSEAVDSYNISIDMIKYVNFFTIGGAISHVINASMTSLVFPEHQKLSVPI